MSVPTRSCFLIAVTAAISVILCPRRADAQGDDSPWAAQSPGSVRIAYGFRLGVQQAPFAKIAVGAEHALALDVDGRIEGWGDPNDSNRCRSPLGSFIAVAAGGATSSAIRADGAAMLWTGSSPPHIWRGEYVTIDGGQDWSVLLDARGNLATINTSGLTSTYAAGPFVEIAAGTQHFLARRADGSVIGVGSNQSGQITIPPGQYAAIFADGATSFGVRIDGTTVAWGAEANGLLAPPKGAFSKIVCGTSFAAGLRPNGELLLWGAPPAALTTMPPGPYVDLAAYGKSLVGLRPNGTIAARSATSAELPVTPAAPWIKASVRSQGRFVLRADGAAYLSLYYANNGKPWFIESGVRDIAIGFQHAFVLFDDGTLVGYGSDEFGQLDAPADTSDIAEIAAGAWHTTARRTDGSVVCWGLNVWGQCDAPGGAFVAIAAGNYHNVALRADGTFAGWGDNWFGQSDDPGGTFTEIDAGLGHTIGLRPDGSITAWGRNLDHECDIPPGTYVHVAAGDKRSYVVRDDNALFVVPQANPLFPVDGPAWRGFRGDARIGTGPDCDANAKPDLIEIALGEQLDANGNGIPDECEAALGDLDGDGVVGPIDLAILLGAWGSSGSADLDHDGAVGPADLALLLGAWTR